MTFYKSSYFYFTADYITIFITFMYILLERLYMYLSILKVMKVYDPYGAVSLIIIILINNNRAIKNKLGIKKQSVDCNLII